MNKRLDMMCGIFFADWFKSQGRNNSEGLSFTDALLGQFDDENTV
jgi:hypothetical protein